MKMRLRKFGTLIFGVALFFSACTVKPLADLSGVWTADTTLRSDLQADPESPDTLFAYLFVKHHDVYTLSPLQDATGTYTLQKTQVFDSVKTFGDVPAEFNEADLALLSSEMTFLGVYTQTKKDILFTVDSVRYSDGTELSYEDYQTLNPFAYPKTTRLAYSLTADGLLNVGGISYTKN